MRKGEQQDTCQLMGDGDSNATNQPHKYKKRQIPKKKYTNTTKICQNAIADGCSKVGWDGRKICVNFSLSDYGQAMKDLT